MNQVYLFNDAVYFYAEYGRLLNQRNGCEATVSQAGTRCLLALLDTPGEVVSAEALIYAGWGSQGIVVTPNSLRQMINQLRKAIKKVGLPDDTLITQPRIGYKLNHVIRVRLLKHPPGDAAKIAPVKEALCVNSPVIEDGLARDNAAFAEASALNAQAAVVTPPVSSTPGKGKAFYARVPPCLTRYAMIFLFIGCVLIMVWNIFFCARDIDIVTPHQCLENISLTTLNHRYHGIPAFHDVTAQDQPSAHEKTRWINRSNLLAFSLQGDDRVVYINGVFHAGALHFLRCK